MPKFYSSAAGISPHYIYTLHFHLMIAPPTGGDVTTFRQKELACP